MNREHYKQVQKDSDAMRETNDCTVKAIALATGVSYIRAHTVMAEVGRVHKNGAFLMQWEKAFNMLGFTLHAEKDITARTVRKVVPMLEADKVYVVQSTRHLSAVVDADVLDWAKGRRKQIAMVFQVLPTGVTPDPISDKLAKKRTTGWKVTEPTSGVCKQIWDLLDDEFEGEYLDTAARDDIAWDFIQRYSFNANTVKAQIARWNKIRNGG